MAYVGSAAVSNLFEDAFESSVARSGATASLFFGSLGFFVADILGKPRLARAALTLILPTLWFLAAALVRWEDTSQRTPAVFLFLAVFPLINALFDTLSYAATLTLMRLGLRNARPFMFGFYDLVIALLLFFGLGATLLIVVATLNRFAEFPILDLGALFDGLHKEPAAYGWLYLMVFSTILPTALHAALSLLGLQSIVGPRWRNRVADLLEAARPDHDWKTVAAPFLLGTLWLLPFGLAALLLWVVWLLAGGWLTGLLQVIYLDPLFKLAQAISAF